MSKQHFDSLYKDFPSAKLLDLNSSSKSSFCLVAETKQKYLLRLKLQDNYELGASTQREVEVLSYLSSLAQVPKVIAETPTYLLLSWMDGENINRWDNKHLAQLAQLLSQPLFCMTTSDIEVKFSPLDYHSSIRKLLSRLPAQQQRAYFTELKQLPSIEFHYTQLVHNDLHKGNILLNSAEQLQIIDWEYAGIGDVYVEIAQLMVNEKWSLSQLEYFFQFYEPIDCHFQEFYERLTIYVQWTKFLNKLWHTCHQQIYS